MCTGTSPLHVACEKGHAACVAALLEAGADVGAVCERVAEETGDWTDAGAMLPGLGDGWLGGGISGARGRNVGT